MPASFADTAKTTKGFLSLKAYRLTQPAIELYKANDFTPEKIKNLKVSYDSLFREVPIVIKNSHLMNEVLLELSEQIPSEAGSQFLDLGTSDVLETQLKNLMDTVDDMNQESIKFNKHQNLMLKQFQEKTRFIQKRQLENQARVARGEDPLPEEDLSKLFKNVPAPSRLNPLILSGTISFTADEVNKRLFQKFSHQFYSLGFRILLPVSC